MCRLRSVALLLSSLTFAVLAPSLAWGQLPAAPTPQSQGAPAATGDGARGDSPENLARLRVMIDRGQTESALKQLDSLATQQPAPAGVNRLRGLALYSQNQFAEAD